MSESSLKPFQSPASPKHSSTPATADQDVNQREEGDSYAQRRQELVPALGRPRDSGIEETLLAPPSHHQQQRLEEASRPGSYSSPRYSSRPTSYSSPRYSTGAVSSHNSSMFSIDYPTEGGGRGGGEGEEGGEGREGGTDGKTSHYVLPVQAKTKKGKFSPKHLVEEINGSRFALLTPGYSYKWFIGLPNSYRLNSKKDLKAREKMVWENKGKKNSITLKSNIEIMPNITEPSNERVAKIGIKLTVKNIRIEDYECVAIVSISLYDPHTQDMIIQEKEERKFARGYNHIEFHATLGSQERIEKSDNRLLELTIATELRFQHIG